MSSPKFEATAKYELENEYLAVSTDGMYTALPNEKDLQLCLYSDNGLCAMNQALYPVDQVEWCVYALFIQNEEKIGKYCHYRFKNTKTNFAQSLGGYM